MLTLALVGATIVRFGPLAAFDAAQLRLAPEATTRPWPAGVVVWVGTFAALRLYNPLRCRDPIEEGRRLVTACMMAPLAMIVGGFLLKHHPSRLWLGLATVFSLVSAGVGRRGLRHLQVAARRRGRWTTPTVVVGRQEAKRVMETLVGDPTIGLRPVASAGFGWGGLPEGSIEDLRELVRRTGAGAVVVVGEDLERHEVQRAVEVGDELPVKVFFLPGLDFVLAHSLLPVPVGREPALCLEAPALRAGQRVAKRLMDLVGAGVGLVVLSPLMAAIALAIKLDSPGPVFFRQPRVGWRGRMFEIVKFRTMVDGAPALKERLRDRNETDGVLFKLSNDPRVTRVGRVLRKLSLDELPQLWNVLRGEMSLVGPRPLPVEDYELEGAGALRRRLGVLPGMTGLWQINGRSTLPTADLLYFDLTYVQNWSLVMDLYILARTVPALIRGRGAY